MRSHALKQRSIIIALATTVLLAGCVSTSTQVTTDYYLVRGSTAAEIDRDIRDKGPMRGHALAVAAISFEPVSVLQEVSEEQCRFKTAKFRVVANVTLPRWADRNASDDRALRSAWSNLSRYAKVHEDTHVRIAETFARELGNEIEALEPRKTCERLDRDAKRVVQRIEREHNRAQLAFDAAEQRRLRALLGS